MGDLGEFLLTTGRTLAQMALYSPEHPSVQGRGRHVASLVVTVFLETTPELVLTTHEKEIHRQRQSGRRFPRRGGAPLSSIVGGLHGLHSLTFMRGITFDGNESVLQTGLERNAQSDDQGERLPAGPATSRTFV